MFKNLLDFSFKRTFIQALGFYIAYFVLGAVLCGIVSGITGQILSAIGYPGIETFTGGYKIGLKVGAFVAVVYCSILSFLVLKQKQLFTQFGAILIALTSILFSIAGACLLGLIPIAILSTWNNKIEA